ncbi:hypothetical protein FOA52_008067 [Chlamydomonas sp. UWO 241]|nr:hypothetical protein FOA52_008067 [Chlamydomonas sp. UWO 241]
MVHVHSKGPWCPSPVASQTSNVGWEQIPSCHAWFRALIGLTDVVIECKNTSEDPEAMEEEDTCHVQRVLQCSTHYEVLQLSSSASEGDVKRARRSLALETHPDKVGHKPLAKEAFQRVAEAAEILADPKARSKYDGELQRGAGWPASDSRDDGYGSDDDVFGAGFGFDFADVIIVDLEDLLLGRGSFRGFRMAGFRSPVSEAERQREKEEQRAMWEEQRSAGLHPSWFEGGTGGGSGKTDQAKKGAGAGKGGKGKNSKAKGKGKR